MAKQLGPTFGDEVIEAGLGGLPLAWGTTDDTITGREYLTAAQNTTLDNVVAAHDPTDPSSILTPADFIARFTNAEYLALEKRRRDDIAANKIGNAKNWDVVIGDSTVALARQKAQNLKTDLVADGILTQARADEIFA
jgi:hypothetical protein